MTQEST